MERRETPSQKRTTKPEVCSQRNEQFHLVIVCSLENVLELRAGTYYYIALSNEVLFSFETLNMYCCFILFCFDDCVDVWGLCLGEREKAWEKQLMLPTSPAPHRATFRWVLIVQMGQVILTQGALHLSLFLNLWQVQKPREIK